MFTKELSINAEIKKRINSLTPRELMVITKLMESKPYKVIAHELGISISTVESYRNQGMEKLGARTLTDLIVIGLKHNFISGENI